LAKKLWRSR